MICKTFYFTHDAEKKLNYKPVSSKNMSPLSSETCCTMSSINLKSAVVNVTSFFSSGSFI